MSAWAKGTLSHEPSRSPHRRRRHGADDQGLEPSLPPPVRGAGCARHDQRDDGGAAPQAEAHGRVRVDSALRRRAVLRRATGGHQSGRDGLGGGAGRGEGRRPRGSQLRMPDRSLHPQGPGRIARTPARPHPPHRRRHEEGGDERAGDGEAATRLERRDAQRPRSGARRGGRRRRRDLRPRPDAQCPLSLRRGLGRHRHRGRRRATCRWSATATFCFPKTSLERKPGPDARA